MKIYAVGEQEAVGFAARELQRYLQRITSNREEINLTWLPAYNPLAEDCLWVGVAADLWLDYLFTKENDARDDEIFIAVEAGKGVISGSNPGAVLLAVYRFLHHCGCRWVRPGAAGEFIPQHEIMGIDVKVQERAAHRHRAICIEGAVSLENVLAMIDWAPKNGFSGYFMQFREGFTFFNRWYTHQHNPRKQPEDFSVELARQFTRRIESELRRRGMLYHAIGHGWTCEAFGIPALGWDMEERDHPPEVMHSLAEVDGKRSMRWNMPVITSLCFSQAEVRRRVVECAADYLDSHRHIDLLHFWLDDGFNNKCECADCRIRLPSDWYVDLLNELDAELTRRGIPNKVVFLAYVDMLWAPQTARILNPERFVFMFAPINRPYRQPLDPAVVEPPPPFVLNRMRFPTTDNETLSFLRPWQAAFSGDSFIFEYYFTIAGAYTNDPDPLHIARVLHQDIRSLHQLGLNGLVSCQVQRIFFPTGLGMYVMGQTLWSDRPAFEHLAADYCAAAFGEKGGVVLDYLVQLSALLDFSALRQPEAAISPATLANAEQAKLMMTGFALEISRHLDDPQPVQAQSWYYLQMHAGLVERMLAILAARAAGDTAGVRRLWLELKQHLQQAEDDLQPVLDVWSFIESYKQLEKE